MQRVPTPPQCTHYKSLKFSQYEDEILRGLSYCRKKIDDSEGVRWECFLDLRSWVILKLIAAYRMLIVDKSR